LRKSNDSLRGGNATSNFPEIPPGATDVGPSSDPGAGDAAVGDVGDVGDAAADRSELREHPAINVTVQSSSARCRDMKNIPRLKS
jgi:hypothetical protein